MKIIKGQGGISLRYNNIGDVENKSFSLDLLLLPNDIMFPPQKMAQASLLPGVLQSKSSQKPKQNTGTSVLAKGINFATDELAEMFSDKIFDDSELGRGLGTLFSSGVSSVGDTLTNNIIKGEFLTKGLGLNVANSLAGAGAGLAAYGIGKGINALGGDTKLSRGIGLGISTGLGTIGGNGISNLFNGTSFLSGFSPVKDAAKAMKAAEDAGKTASEIADIGKATKAASIGNLAGLGMSMVGTGLSAALGHSKEYEGKYGGITKTADSIYDLAQTSLGFVPGGGLVSGIMSLNKGLSNLFGSTSGMTLQDSILGSAFMPFPVKWLNMAGARTTGTFNNLSWQNTEKANDFMGNAFGNLGSKFDKAREEAGKTYGTFSQGAYGRALDNLNFANTAWNQILAMADLNELQNIRSLYMTSINNLRYAQDIQGGWNPLARGKQGMKILNNATNHKVGMRLLSGAALIDNKQMILCNVPD